MAAPPVAPRKQEPSFSVWRTLKGTVKAVPAGVAEATGSTADILGAFGSVTAATQPGAGGMFSLGTEADRKQKADAAKKLTEQGPDFRGEAGSLFRGVAEDYMPDPKTAHGAEVAVAEFARLATKAIAGSVTLGPVAGALVAGAEEGFTAADKLAAQGVDVGTRTKVGALTGAVTGFGFALPIAGRTVAQTAGLVAVGGPGSFVVQNAGTREILNRADYGQLADQYDPLDPVGLALSTLIPLGFGAVAMRNAARSAKAGTPQPVPEVAPMPAAPPAEVVDAARVQLLREQVDAHRATPPEDFAGARAHEAAVSQALEQISAGQLVRVADLPADVGATIADTMGQRLAQVMVESRKVPDLAEFVRESGAVMPDTPEQAAARGNAFITWIKRAGGINFAEKFDIVGERGIRGNYAGIFTKTGQSLDTLATSAVQAGYLTRADVDAATDNGGTRALAELIRRAVNGEKLLTVEQAEAARIADAKIAGMRQAVDQMETELRALGVDPAPARGNPHLLAQYLDENRLALVNARLAEAGEAPPVADVDGPAVKRFDIDALAVKADDLLMEWGNPAEAVARAKAEGQAISPELQNMLVAAAEFAGRIPDLIQQFRALEAQGRGTPIPNLIADTVDAMRASQSADAGRAAGNPLQARLDEATMRNPDALDVRMPTDFDAQGKVSEAVTAREFLDRVKAEADQEAADADLLQVAANCFLNVGA